MIAMLLLASGAAVTVAGYWFQLVWLVFAGLAAFVAGSLRVLLLAR